MELSRELAKDFNKSALEQIAQHAARCASIMRNHCPAPWKMNEAERQALDDFGQLAAYAQRVANML
jgi:hypothetical protein